MFSSSLGTRDIMAKSFTSALKVEIRKNYISHR